MSRRSRWQRFCQHRPAVAGLVFLVVMLAACVGSLPQTARAMRQTHLAQARRPPAGLLDLGTDALGRSMLARMLYGGALSLTLGVVAAVIAVLWGTLWGAVAGYVGGRLDEIMMRIVDVLYTMPTILLVMLFNLSLGEQLRTSGLIGGEQAGLIVLAVAIGAVSWLTVARVVRGQVLALRERPFIEAARALGVPTWRILLVHMLPNLAGPIIVFATLAVPQAILAESFLSFLGVGVQPPQATWGSLAAEGVSLLNPIRVDWWLVVYPCLALALTLLALNFIGDALRDALDVRS